MSQGPAGHCQICSIVSHLFSFYYNSLYLVQMTYYWSSDFFCPLFFFSTSHFLMPIFQEKFPFIQKSSRTLVRYTYTKIMKQENCNMECYYIPHMESFLIFGWAPKAGKKDFNYRYNMNFVVSWLTLPCLPQECYVLNLLRVTVYIPSIRRDVLELVIGKMLQLDVSNSKSETM